MKNKLLSSLSYSSGLGLQFFALTIMTEFFSKIEYATLAFVFTFTSLAAVFSRFGAQPTILKLGVNEYKKIILNTVLLVFPLVIVLGSIISSLVYGVVYQSEYASFVCLITIAVSLNGIASVVFRLKGNILRAVISTKPLEQLVLVIVLIASVYFVFDLKLIVSLFSIIIFMLAVVQLMIGYRAIDVSIDHFNRGVIDKEVVVLATSSMFVNFLQLSHKNIDILLLGYNNIDEQFASYIFAQKFSEFFFFFVPLVNMYFVQYFSRVIANRKELQSVLEGVYRFYKIALIFFVTLFVSFLFLYEIILSFFFENFVDSAIYIFIFSVGKLFLIFSSPFTMLLLINNKPLYVISSLVCAISLIIVAFYVITDVVFLCATVAISYALYCFLNLVSFRFGMLKSIK